MRDIVFDVVEHISDNDLAMIEDAMTIEDKVTMDRKMNDIVGSIFKWRDYESKLLAMNMFRQGYLASYARFVTFDQFKEGIENGQK